MHAAIKPKNKDLCSALATAPATIFSVALSSDEIVCSLQRRYLLAGFFPAMRSPPATISVIELCSATSPSPSPSSFIDHLGFRFSSLSEEIEEQVKVLETESKRKSVESVVYVEKSEVCGEEDVSNTWSNSRDENLYEVSKALSRLVLPEVEASVIEKNVLIRIHCEKHIGVLMHILKLIDKLHLSVLSTTSLPFGPSIVSI
ncbi:Transcription factor [Arachis hypogaea]|nr:Transcription factor [Arachis hypogaea]